MFDLALEKRMHHPERKYGWFAFPFLKALFAVIPDEKIRSFYCKRIKISLRKLYV